MNLSELATLQKAVNEHSEVMVKFKGKTQKHWRVCCVNVHSTQIN